jgi:beta-lactamase class A
MNKFVVYLALPALLGLYSCQDQPPNRGQKAVQQEPSLHTKLEQLAAPYKARIGLALVHIEKGDTLSLNNAGQYPMQSTYKFPLAIAILQLVDKGILSTEQKVHLAPGDLRPHTWSPLREKYPQGNIDISVQELLQYTVSQSDNNACDVLFRLAGGPPAVQQCLQQAGITGIRVVNTEAEMAKDWKIQYDNWARPSAMADLLVLFYRGKLLSPKSTAALNNMMTQTLNSAGRIKGNLPEGTMVAHKTGTSDTNSEGLTAASNDVGIITLPDGQHLAVAVFVRDSKETQRTNENIIALLSKAVFDHYRQ